MKIQISTDIHLELISEKHAQPIFELVDANRTHLGVWLPFVDRMQTVAFAQNFVTGTMQRNKEGIEYAFVIVADGAIVGRIGVYKIDQQNKIGEIGYWLGAPSQGKGIATTSTKGLIDFCFSELALNRIEIKCGTENVKSRRIPERLNFTHEGIIRQGERLYDQYIDLDLFSLLSAEA